MLVMREYRIGDEPIPNYRLVKFLGRGGFGEVWQANAPGGVEVAMKFIRLDKKAGKKEFESLRVVKRIKHPHLMAINAFWLKDADGNVLDDGNVDLLGMNLLAQRTGRKAASETVFFTESQAAELVIALELCDKNLLDRLRECQAAGLQGIPPDELLDYMDGCAKAIDYLNSPVHVLEDGEKKAVQHCDIKPQNIMLLSGEPKVCDFGLVRAQGDVRKTAIAASLAYAPPEILIKGQQSEATDQYSLAVSYYELRTGELPFSDEAANHFAIMKAHEQGTLDFSRLPDGERAVIERATMLNPSARFARTADMVAALRRAYRGESDILPLSSTADRLQTGQELVPGYLLKDYLFRADARTEVWDATHRSGDEHALWIYDLTSYRGEIDQVALRRLRARSHPQLARVFDFWLLDGERRVIEADRVVGGSPPRMLVIASERTRDNLVFLVDECRRRSGDGLPAEHLLGCLKQVAVALDALNGGEDGAAPIAHCDVRPANLLQFGETIKLGNFAWCRALSEGDAELPEPSRRSEWRTTAPEVVHGRPSPRSDQYSLADSYVQMRTGQLLGDSLSSSSHSSGRLSGRLDLTVLRPDEQQVVRRALSEVPAERYASCTEFVEQLARVVQPASVLALGDDGRVQTLEPGDLGSPVKPWKETRPIKKTPTAPISVPRPARGGLRRAVFVTLLLGGMGVGGLLVGRMCVEQSVDRALADGDVGAALAVLRKFERLSLLINRDLNVRTIAAGCDRFWQLKNDDPQAAEQIRMDLAARFPSNPAVQELPVYELVRGRPEAVTPPADGRWAERAIYSLRTSRNDVAQRNAAKAAEELARAQAELDKHPGARPDLDRQLHLVRASLAALEGDWPGVEESLKRASLGDLAGAEAPRLANYHALSALVAARFSKPPLQAAAQPITDALQCLMRLEASDRDWRTRPEYEFAAASDLIEEIARLAARRALGDDGGDRGTLRAWFGDLNVIGLEGLPRIDASAVALAKTLLLVTKADLPSPEEVAASIEAWPASVEPGMEDAVAGVAHALADWGIGSGKLTEAIGHVTQLRGASDERVRAELIRLFDAYVQREAFVDEPDWRALEKAGGDLVRLCEQAGIAVRPFVIICLAECLGERAIDGNDYLQGLEALAKLRPVTEKTAGDERAYFAYADVLARRVAKRLEMNNECVALVDELCQAAAPRDGIFRSSHRRRRATNLLTAAAEELLLLERDAPGNALAEFRIFKEPGGAEKATKADGWLNVARGLSDDKPGSELALALVVAALAKAPAGEAIDPSVAALLDGLQSAAPPTLLLKARAATGAQSVKFFAQLWDTLNASGDDEQLYEQVIKPAIGRINALPPDDLHGVAGEAARLFAAKGQLIRRSLAVENAVFDDDERKLPRAAAIFDAFDRAIQFDRSQPNYFIERGSARYDMSGCDVRKLRDDDIEPARALLTGTETPGLWGLTGAANILDSRQHAGPAERQEKVDLLKLAIQDYQWAVDAPVVTSEERVRFLVGLSMAYLELANYTDEPQDTIRDYLTAARRAAQTATEATTYVAHPEFSLVALGNAEEDFGLLLHDYAHYETAIDAFLAASRQDGVPTGPGLVGAGRAGYRLATSPWKVAQAPARLEAALGSLAAAIDSGRLSQAELAEAYLWKAQVHAVRAALAQQPSSKLNYQQELRSLDDAMSSAIRLVDRSAANWPRYQETYATLATTIADKDNRTRELLKSGNASVTVRQRATAINALAGIQLASKPLPKGSPAAAIVQAFDRGFSTFVTYYPWAKTGDVAGEQDALALVLVAEYIGGNIDFWATKRNLCQQCARRALALAKETAAVDLEARARAALGLHARHEAMYSKPANVTKLREAVDWFQSAIEIDDRLDTAPLPALERIGLRESFAYSWRYGLAKAANEIASNSAISAADKRKFCGLGIAALKAKRFWPPGDVSKRDELLRSLNQILAATN